MNDARREFDVIVVGATGFTGALVAEYLSSRYGCERGLRWAAAGRSEERLTALRASLGPDAAGLPLIVADKTARFGFPELRLGLVPGLKVVVDTLTQVPGLAKVVSQLGCNRLGMRLCVGFQHLAGLLVAHTTLQ